MPPKKTKKGISPSTFDPEGPGYDMETARKHGIKPDSTGHYPSRVPTTGQILKGRTHPTFRKTVEGEKKAGYKIFLGEGGKYYSRKNRDNQAATSKTLEPSGTSQRGHTSRIKNFHTPWDD